MSALTGYAPWLAWAVVPSYATDWALKTLYAINFLARPSSKDQAIRQNARMRACLVGAYLAYLFYNNVANQEPSAYRLLGVDLDCNSEQIKRAFRKLAMVFHPDKVGPQGERFFIALRRSHDVLSDPVKRFAYDRFGISVLDWKDALSYREHMVIGLRDTLAFYIINPIIFAIISWVNKDSSPFALWHFSLLFAFFSCELYLVATPERPELLRMLLPHHTVHDMVLLFHQMYTSLVMASRQIFPLLASVSGNSVPQEPRTLQEAKVVIEQLANQMDQLGVLASGMTLASSQALAGDLMPLRSASVSKASTLPEAAEAIAAKNANQSPSARLNALEDTYVHLVGQRLILDRLQTREDLQDLRLFGQKRAEDQRLTNDQSQGEAAAAQTTQSRPDDNTQNGVAKSTALPNGSNGSVPQETATAQRDLSAANGKAPQSDPK